MKRIQQIEKEIRETPYHKGTEHYIGLLRARLAILRDKVQENNAKKGGGGGGFAVKKHGDATVVLVGFPSVGKSTLLNALTNAQSPTAEYAFTTVSVIPGMMNYNGAKIQILDVPGLVEGAAAGRGRGREVLSVVRAADLLLILAEAGQESRFTQITNELWENGVRVNQVPPNVEIKKRLRGGINIYFTTRQDIDKETVKEICKEFKLVSADIFIREKITLESLVDALAKNRVYTPALYVVSKFDKLAGRTKLDYGALCVSAEKGIGLENLKEEVWNKLGFVRVFLQNPYGGADNKPLIMRSKETLKDILAKIGPAGEGKKEAKIWGPGARFPGQTVPLTTTVQDQMSVLFV